MSRRKAKPSAVAPTEPPPPAVDAVALLRAKHGGHSIVKLALPLSVVEQYATATEAPEVRAIVAGKLVQWVEGVP